MYANSWLPNDKPAPIEMSQESRGNQPSAVRVIDDDGLLHNEALPQQLILAVT
jgi:hypothetical protein